MFLFYLAVLIFLSNELEIKRFVFEIAKVGQEKVGLVQTRKIILKDRYKYMLGLYTALNPFLHPTLQIHKF